MNFLMRFFNPANPSYHPLYESIEINGWVWCGWVLSIVILGIGIFIFIKETKRLK